MARYVAARLTMITVVCYLWNDPARKRNYTFSQDHVHILKSMVERNLTLPHRFICVTDEEIDDIETVPIDWSKHVPGTCAVKLMSWRPDAENIFGKRILTLDLDIVIVDNVDALFGRSEPCILLRNPNYPRPRRAFYQGSIQLHDAGVFPELWNDYDPQETPKWVGRRFGGQEQAWISERLSWNLPFWDQRHGIYGAGRLFNGAMDSGVQTVLPKNARIVVVPGNREPSQPEVQQAHPWIKEHYH